MDILIPSQSAFLPTFSGPDIYSHQHIYDYQNCKLLIYKLIQHSILHPTFQSPVLHNLK